MRPRDRDSGTLSRYELQWIELKIHFSFISF